MNSLIPYLVKSALVYLIGYALFWVLFRKETFFIRNRIYLLASLLLPAMVPLVRLPASGMTGMDPGKISRILDFSGLGSLVSDPSAMLPAGETAARPVPFPWEKLLLVLYLAGLVFFLLRMLISYSAVIRMIVRADRKRVLDMVLVITRERVSPFSIFRWLVVPGYRRHIPNLDQLIRHERIHFRQLHSIDLLLSELVLVFQWFNPAAWLLKWSVVRNNEFYVDRRLIADAVDIRPYQYALLNGVLGGKRMAMVSHFNKDLIKKRIEMMNKQNSRLINRVKNLLIVPLTVLVLVAFSAYTGKPDLAAPDPGNHSLLTVPTVPEIQDPVKKTDSIRKLDILIDGNKLIIKNLDSPKKGEVLHFIPLSDSAEASKIVPVEKIEELLKDSHLNKEQTLIAVRKVVKAGQTENVFVGHLVSADTVGGGMHRLKLENDGDRITILTSEGKSGTLYIADRKGKTLDISIARHAGGKDRLLVVNGRIQDAGEWLMPDPDSIRTVVVLSPDDARKEYGEKGKNGAIVILTRK